jgi:hypothetical protein
MLLPAVYSLFVDPGEGCRLPQVDTNLPRRLSHFKVRAWHAQAQGKGGSGSKQRKEGRGKKGGGGEAEGVKG